MRRVAATVALAFLLALAGCSALPGGGGNDAAPPGVSDGELSNRTALLAAHEEALVSAGFEHSARVNATAIRRTQNGQRTVPVARQQSTTVAEDGSYRYRLVNGGTGAQIDAWANQSTEVGRIQVGGQTRYQTGDPQPPGRLSGRAFLRPYLGGELEVESTNESDGRTYYTLVSTTSDPPEGTLPANATDVENYQSRVVVDGEGRIHALTATADYTIQGEQATLDVRYRLERMGVDSVERPGWVDEAG